MENQVSIIINGTRYDAVEKTNEELTDCESCDFSEICSDVNLRKVCADLISTGRVFEKSTKSFES